jgi:uncharacterized protein YndB with AHSA1/START domain
MESSGKLKIAAFGDREIVITRVFDAPRHVVYSAMTQPELLKRWLLGPPGWSMVTCEVDLSVGGKFRYVWRTADGMEMAMSGVYREIVPNERVVNTQRFDFGCESQSGEQVGRDVLVEEEGRTTLICTLLYPSKDARDATLASGMSKGVAASYDRLAELLSTSQTAPGNRSARTA